MDQVQEPQRLERKTVRLLHRDTFFMILLRGPLVALCVVALTGLNEPLCISFCLVIIYCGWSSQCSIFVALFETALVLNQSQLWK